MDYYQLLRVSSHASTRDIEEAYQRLLRESRYDSSIDLRDVATAYRILSDPKQKAAYDHLVKAKDERNTAYTATIARRKKSVPHKWSIRQLIVVFIVLALITTGYYVIRFGYLFNDFSAGDEIYMSDTNQKVGTVLKHEMDHDFGTYREGAYLVRTDHGDIWFSSAQVKMRCYKKTSDPSS